MNSIDTFAWELAHWYEVIDWCRETFGPADESSGVWDWDNDYSLWMNDECLALFLLRWA
jgi:hypothetical protein